MKKMIIALLIIVIAPFKVSAATVEVNNYLDLQAAVDNGDMVILTSDISLEANESISVSDSLYLDGNGFEITSISYAVVANGTEVYISIENTIFTVEDKDHAGAIHTSNGATLVINNCEFNSPNGYGATTIQAYDSDVLITNSVFSGMNQAIMIKTNDNGSYDASGYIEGNTFTDVGYAVFSIANSKNSVDTNVTIVNNTFTNVGTFIAQNEGVFTVSYNTFITGDKTTSTSDYNFKGNSLSTLVVDATNTFDSTFTTNDYAVIKSVVTSEDELIRAISEGGVIVVDDSFSVTDVVLAENDYLIINKGATITVTGDIQNSGVIENNGTIKTDNEVSNIGVYKGEGVISVNKSITVNKADYLLTTTDELKALVLKSVGNLSSLSEIVLNADAVSVDLTYTQITYSTASDDEILIMDQIAQNYNNLSKFFDLSLILNYDEESVSLSSLDEKITVSVDIPNDIEAVETGYIREYFIVRYHDGEIEKIDCLINDDESMLTFETDKFSLYAISYEDSIAPADNPETSDMIMIAIVTLVISLTAIIVIGYKVRKNKKLIK